MNIVVAPRLLIKSAPTTARSLSLMGGTVGIRELCPNETGGPGIAAAPAARWYLAELGVGATVPSPGDVWDMAHEAAQQHNAYVEPDIGVQWDYQNHVRIAVGAAPGDLCSYSDQSEDFPRGPGFAWHLDASQLKAARNQVGGNPARVRIGILDTGFDFHHQARPEKLLLDLQRNFTGDERPLDDASDPYCRGLFRNPGHGTGTIGLLAGRLLRSMAQPEQNGDYLGGAPLAEIVPVRIAAGVVLLYSSAFASGLDYLIAPNGNRADRVDVVSMSMGGVASRAWADVVNRAYEAGIVMVTAAGNNYPLTPQSIVYPARFRRVIAACGVMADGKPYIRENVPFGKMAGNYGPDSKMDTALAAFTPNTPWAEINCEAIVDMDGAGTSSATPQVAAAAALWLQKHKNEMADFSPQEKVEAARKALFDTAKADSPECRKYFGRGILQAAEALKFPPRKGLPATEPDSAGFSFWKVVFGRGIAAADEPEFLKEMLGVEAAQLFHIDPAVAKSMDDPDIARKPTQGFIDAVIGSPFASKALKAALKGGFTTAAVPGAGLGKPPGPEPPKNQVLPAPQPRCRHLRAYATDPSLSLRLATAESNEITIPVIWEPLAHGPAGEYLEIVDHDPATGCFYAPVDLEDSRIIANDGLDVNPGDPRFHQQMVYAVAMRTIRNFETALGRKALWSPMMDPGSFKDDRYVQRLRVYPHAFRDRNAYYNPEKKALLFGYFPVQGVRPGVLYPDGMAFTCLSHDIVAHETTHALLDGMHRNLSAEGSVDDLAFHEAFADIVALFQHFSLPDVLKTEIARTRGDLGIADRLAEIGQEFGKAIGLHGALRRYIGRKPDPSLIGRTAEPHDRGSLLVAAVFDAFLSIYMRRTADLFRMATEGTGILRPGSIHPDLAGRLASEARTAAQHVLTMCIRALDFCPPVDLDFGDYLRAIVTADYEVARDDERQYRVALVEAFGKWGIYPGGMQTLAPATLVWRGLQFLPESQAILSDVLQNARQFADESRYLKYSKSFPDEMPLRERQFRFCRKWREELHELLKDRIRKAGDDERLKLGADLGLDFSTGRERFEIHSLRVAEKIGPDNATSCHLILQILQHRDEAAEGIPFRFSGGATLIVDERSLEVKYAIRKSVGSSARLDRARAALTASGGLRRIYLSGTPFAGMGERFAILHKRGDEPGLAAGKSTAKTGAKHSPAGAAEASASGSQAHAAAPEDWKVRIRMYRKWLGDCFLLTFRTGENKAHILIDCGALTGTPEGKRKITDAVEDIVSETGGRLAALVVTHEHWDHVSGFSDAFDSFKKFSSIAEVWAAWTEDPNQAVAREKKKVHRLLLDSVQAALRVWAAAGSDEDFERGAAVAAMMDFMPPGGPAAFSESTDAAMNNALSLGRPRFLSPGDTVEVKEVPGLRAYVLAPPEDPGELHTMLGEAGKDMYGFSLGLSQVAGTEAFHSAAAARSGSADRDRYVPFETQFQWDEKAWAEDRRWDGLAARYQAEPLRKIDRDWLNSAAELALQLDSYTNNTSLVLAFELPGSGEVLLFVGDAQVGNWRSWVNVRFQNPDVSAADLLSRTVFYKVGHHGSHNATLKDGGLEAMTSPKLVAAIPVDEECAHRPKGGCPKGWDMPAGPLLAALQEKTAGRVLRADSDFPEGSAKPGRLTDEDWDEFKRNTSVREHFVEYFVR